MGAPAAHEVEDDALGGQLLPEEIADGGDGSVVDVDDETGLDVEEGVDGLVLPAEELRGEGRVRAGEELG